ncbi:MAG: LysM peptidoglycan-binding domain-containing protein [Anaerolineales bacterium]|nr:LysM peptidoglycan-binding domain-containing protein [Anaerolineales bacterium]
MLRRTLWAILIAASLLGMGSLGRDTAVAAQSPTTDILTLVNALRASYGLPPFEYNPTLAVAAQNHANWMSQTAVYSHTGAGGSTPQTRANAAGYPGYVSENIVGGTKLTPQQGVTWWRNSAVHFNTMISTRYTQAGVGFAQGHDQNFYVLVVGQPDDAPVATTDRQEEVAYANIPFFVEPIEVSPPREDGSIWHTVGEGHTLWAIAARYEVSIADIMLYNNLTEDSTIQPGDELLIRLAEGQEPPPTPTPPATHKVQPGDSAWTIAAWYNLDLGELLWLNNMQIDDTLQPGEEVKIRLLPGEEPPPTPTPQLAHIVQSGDTLWAIALRYGLSLDQLLTYNNITESNLLAVGQELLIVPPTPLPTPTSEPTLTMTPAATAVPTTPAPPTFTPQATPVALAANVPTPTPSADSSGEDLGQIIGIGAMALALGLVLIAGIGFVFWRRE